MPSPVGTLALAGAIAAILTACARPATLPVGGGAGAAPARVVERQPLAVAADSAFWRILHAGAYDSIPRALAGLQVAYLRDPADAVTTAHIGFLHAWRLAERARMTQPSPGIVDAALLARRYFDLANQRAPSYDARTHGFAAVMRMSEGGIHGDTALIAEGLAQGRTAIARWPEFNLFTIGYVLGAQPDTSALFREGLDMQWRALEACRRRPVSRSDPEFQPGLGDGRDEADPHVRRACYNSWIAPHNLEGFFLNMGDLVMRSGDWRTARKVYALARQAEAYPAWPYRDVLEARIRDAETSVPAFRGEGRALMLHSRIACTACHQAR
jgi:hypothetical protein